MKKVRPLLIHILLLTLILSTGGLTTLVLLQNRAAYTDRLGRIRTEIDKLEQLRLENPDQVSGNAEIPLSLWKSIQHNQGMSNREFTSVIEGLFRSQGMGVLSFQPGLDEFAVLDSRPPWILTKSGATRIQSRGSLYSLLTLLSRMENEYPWIRIERFSYRPLSASGGEEIQAEFLLHFLRIAHEQGEYPELEEHIILEESRAAEASYSGRMYASFSLPEKDDPGGSVDTAEESPANTGPPRILRARQWEYLGMVRESGTLKYSLKYVPDSRVILLSAGQEWKDWQFQRDEESRLIFRYSGEEWYIPK